MTGLFVATRWFLAIPMANGLLPSRMALTLTRISILRFVLAATLMVRPVRVIADIPLDIGVMTAFDPGTIVKLLLRSPLVKALLGIRLTGLTALLIGVSMAVAEVAFVGPGVVVGVVAMSPGLCCS